MACRSNACDQTTRADDQRLIPTHWNFNILVNTTINHVKLLTLEVFLKAH